MVCRDRLASLERPEQLEVRAFKVQLEQVDYRGHPVHRVALVSRVHWVLRARLA